MPKGTDERTLPEVHFDFCFMGDEAKGKDGTKAEETMPVLVVREVKSKMTLSTAVPSKSTGTFVARPMVGFLCEKCDVVAKSDQEPAITSIVSEVERWRQVHCRVQPGRQQRQQWSGGEGDLVRGTAGAGHEGRPRARDRHAAHAEAPIDDVDHRVCRSFAQPLPGRPRRKNGVREVQGRAGENAWHRVRGSDLVEVGGVFAKMTCLCEDGVYLGGEGGFTRDHCDKNGVEDEVRAEEAVEPAMGGVGLGGGQAHAVESARQRPQGGRGEAGD